MIEPEMAFADLYDDMANAEAFVKAVVSHVLQHCKDDLAFFQKFYDKTLLDRLTTVGAAGHSLLSGGPLTTCSFRLMRRLDFVCALAAAADGGAVRPRGVPRGDQAAAGGDRQGPQQVAVPGRGVRHRPADRARALALREEGGWVGQRMLRSWRGLGLS